MRRTRQPSTPDTRCRCRTPTSSYVYPSDLARSWSPEWAWPDRSRPTFMSTAAEDAQHIGLARIGFGQRLSVANAHHLGAALLVLAWQARNVRKVSWLGRITHINDRGAAVFGLSGQSVHRLWHVYRSTVMPDIGDVAVALM